MRDEQPKREEEAQNKGKREMDGSKRARRIHMSRKVKIIIREMDGSRRTRRIHMSRKIREMDGSQGNTENPYASEIKNKRCKESAS